jgi:hypothetical protein
MSNAHLHPRHLLTIFRRPPNVAPTAGRQWRPTSFKFRETGVNRAWTGNIEHRLAFDTWKALKRRTEMSRIAFEMPPIPTESDIPPSNPRKRQLPSVYTSNEAKAILIERDNAKKRKLLVRNKEHALNRPLMNIHDKE